MVFYEKFARKYFEEAEKDLKRALRSIEFEDYSESVFHLQQCVEKAVKAMIEAKKKYVYNHGPMLGTAFSEAFSDEWRDEFDRVLDIIGWFTEYYTRSRYPFLLRGEVVSPDEFIDREVAEEALKRAREVLDVARRYLAKKGII
ncbi:MAG: HEPN domain-containing protein [Candidatus Korarchaeota archaeon]|nr:HEPN domain-containing protein [Candidatus Korarchaeota archaeon]